MLTQLVWFQPPLPSPAISSQANYPDEKFKVLMNRQTVNKPFFLCEAFTTLALLYLACYSPNGAATASVCKSSSCSSRLPLIRVTPRDGSRGRAACGEYRSTSYMSWTLPSPLITSHIHLPGGGGDAEYTSRMTHSVETGQCCRCTLRKRLHTLECDVATVWFGVVRL